jgi:hypothetical protein
VTIRGYVYSHDVLITRVDILVDGIVFGEATYGDSRAEACEGLDPAPPNCPRATFRYNLNTGRTDLPLLNGPHTISIRVIDETGAHRILPETLPITVSNTPRARPVGFLTAPVHNGKLSGTAKIWGFAWSPEGSITAVSLYIDGYLYGTIPYGQERAEQCEALSNPRGCPNIGFEMDFDTRRLSNGVHSLGIQVRDDKGQTAFFPDQIYFGINVEVNNPQ